MKNSISIYSFLVLFFIGSSIIIGNAETSMIDYLGDINTIDSSIEITKVNNGIIINERIIESIDIEENSIKSTIDNVDIASIIKIENRIIDIAINAKEIA